MGEARDFAKFPRDIVGVLNSKETRQEDIGSKKGTLFQQICGNDLVSIMRRLGPQFHVSVEILQKAGDPYTHFGINPETKRPERLTGVVPQDTSYIEVYSARKSLDDYWDAVEAEEASQLKPSNPPKI